MVPFVINFDLINLILHFDKHDQLVWQVYLVVRPGESIVLRAGDQLQQVQGKPKFEEQRLTVVVCC